MPQPFFSTTHLPLDVLHVKTTNILQLDAFEQIPDSFLRIEIRGIGRQAFEMDAFGTAFCQKVFDSLATMNSRSVPDHQQFAWDLPQEYLQKANDIGSLVGMVLRLHAQVVLLE